MFPHLNQDLNDIYVTAVDLRSRRFATLAEYDTLWEEDAEHAVEVIRDAKCAEAVMLWAHHLTEGGKSALGQRELPTVPTYDTQKASSETYESSFNCVTGHSMKADHTSDHVWPHWPEDLHYTAKGHGAYPFWSGLALMMALQIFRYGGASGFSQKSFTIQLVHSHIWAQVCRVLTSWLVGNQIHWATCTRTPSVAKLNQLERKLRSLQHHSLISWTISHTRGRLIFQEFIILVRRSII